MSRLLAGLFAAYKSVWPTPDVVDDGVDAARSGGNGRKLQLLDGRLLTRVYISVMSRCCTEVSCRNELV